MATLLVCTVLVPAVSAQGNDYSVTAEKAFEHANAQMISYASSNTQIFEEWKGATIDPKPLEIYDINGQKLFYQFSIYNSNKIIGKISVCADKTLGQSIQSINLDPKPFDADNSIKKSIEIATKKYPTGKIMSTKIVEYDYPNIGAMTV